MLPVTDSHAIGVPGTPQDRTRRGKGQRAGTAAAAEAGCAAGKPVGTPAGTTAGAGPQAD